MSSWSADILERAAAALPGSTPDILGGEFDRLMVDFLRRSRVWRLELYELFTTDQQLDLSEFVLNARVAGIIGSMGHNRRVIHPATGIRLAKYGFSPGTDPMYYSTLPSSKSIVEFFPELSIDIGGISAEVFLAHLPGGYAEIPEDVCFDYAEALLAGVTGRMQLMPKKPFSDPKLGAAGMIEYRKGVNEARITANKGRTTATEPWRYPGFA